MKNSEQAGGSSAIADEGPSRAQLFTITAAMAPGRRAKARSQVLDGGKRGRAILEA